MDFNPSYWENRYAEGNTQWDAGKITTPLKSYIDQLRDKKIHILIPGAGNAYEAGYLWQSGFTNVYVNDFASHPLEQFKAAYPDFPGEQLLRKDFFDLEPGYDLIIEQTFFCALPPSKRLKYSEKCYELLNTGGRLAGVLFDAPLNTEKPPFGGNKNEYMYYFRPYFHIHCFNRCYNSVSPRAGRELFVNLEKT